jgi:hypothetical protein
MTKFQEWMEDREKRAKLEAMRRWLWAKEHNDKRAAQPVQEGDPDYNWVMKRAAKLGPLDPHTYKEV